jgi:hypothetical protein
MVDGLIEMSKAGCARRFLSEAVMEWVNGEEGGGREGKEGELNPLSCEIFFSLDVDAASWPLAAPSLARYTLLLTEP